MSLDAMRLKCPASCKEESHPEVDPGAGKGSVGSICACAGSGGSRGFVRNCAKENVSTHTLASGHWAVLVVRLLPEPALQRRASRPCTLSEGVAKYAWVDGLLVVRPI